jgi:hypothetical protein
VSAPEHSCTFATFDASKDRRFPFFTIFFRAKIVQSQRTDTLLPTLTFSRRARFLASRWRKTRTQSNHLHRLTRDPQDMVILREVKCLPLDTLKTTWSFFPLLLEDADPDRTVSRRTSRALIFFHFPTRQHLTPLSRVSLRIQGTHVPTVHTNTRVR